MVFQLGGDGAQGAPGVDYVHAGADFHGSGPGLRCPAVEKEAHGVAVPSGKVGQALIGEDVVGAAGTRQ